MKSTRVRKKKEAIRRIVKRVDRTEDTKDGELKSNLKAADVSKARSKPLSVAAKKVLREEENSRTAEPGFSGYFRKKHKDAPGLSALPSNESDAKKFATENLRPTAKPTEYWYSLQ